LTVLVPRQEVGWWDGEPPGIAPQAQMWEISLTVAPGDSQTSQNLSIQSPKAHSISRVATGGGEEWPAEGAGLSTLDLVDTELAFIVNQVSN